MTKVLTVLITAVLLAPGVSLGMELDGFSWELMNESSRYLLVSGYVHGFRHGTVYGADFGINRTSKLLKDLGANPVYGVRIFKDYALCGTSIDKNRESILKAAARYAKNSLNESVEYYVGEVNSFYKQYPSCKGKDLMAMLTEISLVWIRMRTYRDVGDECTKME